MNYNNDSCMIHKVRSGDTMYILSRMYNVRIDDLLSANPMVNIYNMQIGDEVCIPVRPKPIPISIPRNINIPIDESMNNDMDNNMSNDMTGGGMLNNGNMPDNMDDDFYEMVKRFDK